MNLFEMKSFAENCNSKTAQKETTFTRSRLEIKQERGRWPIHDLKRIQYISKINQRSCFEVLDNVKKKY